MKKLYGLLLSTILSITCSYAQTTWTFSQALGGSPRFAATDFVVGHSAYILGGTAYPSSQWEVYNDLWNYDPLSDKWIMVGTFPGGRVYGGVSFVIDGKAYVGMGANQFGTENNQLWAYSTGTGLWTRKADLPSDERIFAFAFSSGGKGYVGGGRNGNSGNLNDFWEYDPTSDTWTQKRDYPGAGRVGLASFTANDQGYVGLGDDGDFFYTDFYAYLPDQNQWEARSTFPGVNRSFNSAVGVAHQGFVIGGEQTTSTFTKEMWAYDAYLDTWFESHTFTGAAKISGNLFYINESLYYGLGKSAASGDKGTSDFWKLPGSLVDVRDMEKEGGKTIVYPIPVSRQLYITLEEVYAEVRVTIRDVQGREVKQKVAYQVDKLELNVPDMYGVYFIEITGNGGTTRRRIVAE